MQSSSRRFLSFHCDRCGYVRNFTKRAFEHPRHLAATVLTLGLWGIPWAILARQDSRKPWRCCVCGSRQMPKDASPAAAPLGQEATIRISPRRSAR